MLLQQTSINNIVKAVNKRGSIDEDYMYSSVPFDDCTLYGSVDGDSTKQEINDCEKFFAVNIGENFYQHGDTFTNGCIFLFCTVFQAFEEATKKVYCVFIAENAFLEAVTNDKTKIGFSYYFFILLFIFLFY